MAATVISRVANPAVFYKQKLILMFMANPKKSCNTSRQILDPCHGEAVREIPLGVDSAEGRVAGLGSQHDFRGKVMKNAF